ncbi:hypothetical protein Ddye_016257 [Dipteronia dyeriana]|uniref:RRM domain-containing protein n=1 Tax=Dipteronia dyeriana TaxID=168575 RepID=A0AAD9WZX8_9ROSI|nr:hypothetical protein Ddye_016257 [Dipteronia dyeriana]
MRETVRERRVVSFGREYKRKGFNAGDARRDYRESLVSIFIDNLNPKVDSIGLWGIFKPFGKVRNVYLSTKRTNINSCFAFIRFETMEEAVKVAKMVNGMHVYGWPINSKVAAYGWNCHRTHDPRPSQFQPKSREEDGLLKDRNCEDQKVEHKGSRSYVELVIGLQKSKSRIEEEWVMSWNDQNNEDEWLSRCAVGILKDFTNMERVNHRLSSRGFSFCLTYLGDKLVLWCFDSDIERDGFVKNKFFWDDRFSSMAKWSSKFTPQARLVWIRYEGVPMRFWKEDFFMKLGWLLGEPLMIEEDTVIKWRFDRGKKLLLVPKDLACLGLQAHEKNSLETRLEGSQKITDGTKSKDNPGPLDYSNPSNFSPLSATRLGISVIQDDTFSSRPSMISNEWKREGEFVSGRELLAIPQKSRRRKKCYSSKQHDMKIRNARRRLTGEVGQDEGNNKAVGGNHEDWILEEEIAKVIDKGIFMGYDFKKEKLNDQSRVNWSLEDEITKVIEMGVSLSFDFNGKEKVIEEEIMRRESEDMCRVEGLEEK